MNANHEHNMDAAQREIDRRAAEGEPMDDAIICPRTYVILRAAPPAPAKPTRRTPQTYRSNIMPIAALNQDNHPEQARAAALLVSNVSTLNNGAIERIGDYVRNTLPMAERARFIERLSALISSTAERLVEDCQ